MSTALRSLPVAACIAGFLLPAAAAACNGEARHRPTPMLADVPDNSWILVSHGDVQAPLGIMAYSGGWYDADHHQFCIFGGGHYNYSGNEVWCFDIATLTWREMYPPDVVTVPPYDGGDQGAYNNFDNDRFPGALFHPAGESIDSARPMSRHTYDALEYAGGVGAILWGGVNWGDIDMPWCVRCVDTWRFDWRDASWHYLYDGNNPAPNTSPGVGASAWSSHDRRLYAKVRQDTWAYDPARNDWQQVRTRGAPPGTIEGTLEYDPVRRDLYFFGGNYEPNLSLWRFDIEDRRWQEVDAAGEGPQAGASNGPGVAFDTVNDVLLVYYGGGIWAYDPERNAWQARRPERHPSDNSYVYGRFRYDPVNNGAWLHVPEDDRHATWFYRYRSRAASGSEEHSREAQSEARP